MAYGYWDKPSNTELREFDAKAFSRKDLSGWDAKWHLLSTDARKAYLDTVKGPSESQGLNSTVASVSVDILKPKVLDELRDAGFVFVEPSRAKNKPDRLVAAPGATDFARRVRGLRRQHLLDLNDPGNLTSYVDWMFHGWLLWPVVETIAQASGISSPDMRDAEALSLIANFRWPGWVAKALGDSAVKRVIEAVSKAGGPVPLVELESELGPNDGGPAIRGAIDRLVSRLALVEDLDPTTLDIIVGFLPSVRAGLAKASMPRVRMPLLVCEAPREFGPEGGLVVDDLRSVLLEVVAEAPRIRQDGGLFVKEQDRFLAALQGVPAWLSQVISASQVRRLSQAIERANTLDLLRVEAVDNELRLQLSSQGEAWLSAAPQKQYADVFDAYQAMPRSDAYRSGTFGSDVLTLPQFENHFYSFAWTDQRFLGSGVTVFRAKKGRGRGWFTQPRDEEITALRNAIGNALLELPIGVFHVFESVVSHFSAGPDNVVMLGRKPEEVTLCVSGAPFRPFEEDQETVGRLALQGIILTRLIPLGALQAAVDDQGRLCVARTDRLAPYFGMGPLAVEEPAEAVSTKVVIQPDFSVVVIGLASGPVADLMAFCERVTRGGGGTHGAVELKITRQAVVRAVGLGLSGELILQRLRTYASKDLPANVEREIKEWSGRVRKIKPETLKVVRCPDRETADRVTAVMRKAAERLNETIVVLNVALSKQDRKKLQEQGILVEGGHASARKTTERTREPSGWSQNW